MKKILIGTVGEIVAADNKLVAGRDLNQSIGRYMIGVGAIIKHPSQDKILITKRDKTDFQKNAWELVYGRIDQDEELIEGLLREIREELGPIKIKIERVIRLWHFYRGEKRAETEIHGVTFVCQALDTNIKLSAEHSIYDWVSPQKALKKITLKGIKHDIRQFIHDNSSQQQGVYLSDKNHDLIHL